MRRCGFADDNILNLLHRCKVWFAVIDIRFVVELRLKCLPPEGVFIVKIRWLWGLMAALLLAACQPGGPLRQFTTGDVLASYDFAGEQPFEVSIYEAASLQVVNQTYQVDVKQGDNTVWWGQGGDEYGDVIIDVDTNQLSQRNENTYGVMCRAAGAVGQPESVDPTLAALVEEATPEATAENAGESEATPEATAESTPEADVTAEATAEITAEPTDALTATLQPTRADIRAGDGYLFLLQGNGTFAIMRSRDRDLTPLVDWRASDAIRKGPGENHIRAICAGDYLALYVNDQFLGDATDSTYTSGQVGMAASAATRLGTQIAFDNLTISAPAPK